MPKYLHSCVCVVVGLSSLMLEPQSSDAGIFRRRGGGGQSTGLIAATVGAVTKPVVGFIRDRGGIQRDEYDYNWAARRNWHQESAPPMLFADKVRVKLLLTDQQAKVRPDLRVRASWVYLHKSKTLHTAWVELQQDGSDVYYDLPGLEEGRVVKVVSDFYLKTDQQPPNENAVKNASFVVNGEGTFKYVGRMHVPYYGVTSSNSNEELKRRAWVVSFGLSQWYVDEAYGGRRCSYDCYSFYRTSTSGELEGFALRPIPQSSIPELARKGKRFHGDFLIKPGHYGMALCYDEDTGNFCTLEGNYALNGPYRINIDPYRHGLNTWSSIMTISPEEKAQPAAAD
jgi:hypothetical protein